MERAIQRIKEFEILDFLLHQYRSRACQIFQVCAALTNLQNPLLKETEKFRSARAPLEEAHPPHPLPSTSLYHPPSPKPTISQPSTAKESSDTRVLQHKPTCYRKFQHNSLASTASKLVQLQHATLSVLPILPSPNFTPSTQPMVSTASVGTQTP